MAVHSAKGRVVVGGFLRAKLAASPLAARTFATLASPLVAGADLFLPGGASTLGSLCSPASLEILWGGVFGGGHLLTLLGILYLGPGARL